MKIVMYSETVYFALELSVGSLAGRRIIIAQARSTYNMGWIGLNFICKCSVPSSPGSARYRCIFQSREDVPSTYS